MNIRKGIILTVFLAVLYLLPPTVLFAWSGYDYDTENYIEIDADILTIQGKHIEIYDYSDESYHEVYVISVSNGGKEIDVLDQDTGDYRTFEAEADDGQNCAEALWQTSLSKT